MIQTQSIERHGERRLRLRFLFPLVIVAIVPMGRQRILRLALLMAAATSLPVVAHADKLVTKLRVSVETLSIRKIDAATPTRVVFADAPVKGEVALVAALLPSPTKAADAMPLPGFEKARAMPLLAVALMAATPAKASTVTLSIGHHIAVAKQGEKRTVLRAAFVEDALVANVQLDMYALPQLPSTRANLEDLKRLSAKTWWRELSWDIRDAGGQRQSVQPRLIHGSVRERGPNAPNAADRDTSVECTTYEGSFDLGRLPPGDYTVQVTVKGLQSPRFPLALRTGREPDVRDVYLQEKARKTTDWPEFKALQLERVRLDPTKAAALLELAQRSLEFGTLGETNEYFDRAAKTMEQNINDWSKVNPADAKKQAPAVKNSVKSIRALQRVLPEYFANRGAWRVAVDATTGRYVVMTRDTNRVVRRIQ